MTLHGFPTRLSLVPLVALVACVALGGCGSGRLGSRRTSTTDRSSSVSVGTSTHTVAVDGGSRTYRTYLPAGLDLSKPVALVVMLHGGFGSARQAEESYGWDAAADADQFVVAYPDGRGRAWNAGSCCGRPAADATDDVAFIERVVNDVGARIHLDSRRTFVTGMSNGAMMALRLACKTRLFAAVAPVAGAQMVPCGNPEPTSVLQIHGTADQSVPLDGSPGSGRGHVPAHTPIPVSIERWRSVDGCDRPTVTVEGAVTTSSASCPSGRAVTLITVDGAGHQWPGASERNVRLHELLGADPPSDALDATKVIWRFFADHPAPG